MCVQKIVVHIQKKTDKRGYLLYLSLKKRNINLLFIFVQQVEYLELFISPHPISSADDLHF